MLELSLNILDIAMNSVKAGATLIHITLIEDEKKLEIIIKDNGSGISEDNIKHIYDPFFTTRTTRNVGLGIPFYKMSAEMTGGTVRITSSTSPEDHGTTNYALFYKDHIDFVPLGDITETVITLIQGSPDIDFIFSHTWADGQAALSTIDMREMLGEVPLDSFEVLSWAREFLRESYAEYNNKEQLS